MNFDLDFDNLYFKRKKRIKYREEKNITKYQNLTENSEFRKHTYD